MNSPVLLVLLVFTLMCPRAWADANAVRSSAYSAGLEQAEIHSKSGAVAAELEAVLTELEANGLKGGAAGLASGARDGLRRTVDKSLVAALSQLKGLSETGDAAGLLAVLRTQQEAEVALRTVSAGMGKGVLNAEALLLAKSLVARQSRALRAAQGAETSAITLEQQAIALQTQDLLELLFAPNEEMDASHAAILARAGEVARATSLLEKAERAAKPEGTTREQQAAVRDALRDVEQVLMLTKPASERLRELVGRATKLKDEAAAAAAGKNSKSADTGNLASEAEDLAETALVDSPGAAASLKAASQAMRKPGDAQSPKAAEAALDQAVREAAASLARAEAVEASSVADAAGQLKAMAERARALADIQAALSNSTSPSASTQEQVKQAADKLKSESAALAPQASAELAEATKKMQEGKSQEAAQAMSDAAQTLAQQATSAAQAAAQDAQLAAAQSAVDQALKDNQAAQASLDANKAGEAAAKAMSNQSALEAMAASSAMAAAKAAAASPQTAESMRETARVATEASRQTKAAAQSAAQQQLAAAKKSNMQAASSLSQAASALEKARGDLRAQAGLQPPKSEEFASGENPDVLSQGGSSTWTSEELEDSSGLRFAKGAAITAEERAAMSELRKTTMPQEFSGVVSKYFESLASAP